MKKIHSKKKALEWSQHFSHCKSMGIFSDTGGARVVTTLCIDFSDAKGQMTPELVVGSCRNLN